MRTFKLVNLISVLALALAACGPAATETPIAEPTQAPPTNPPAPTATTAPQPTAAPIAEATKAPLPEGVVNILTIKIKPGVQWSDGTELTTKDILGTYNILWAQQDPVWSFINEVKAIDDHSVEFYVTSTSPRGLRLLLRFGAPVSYAVYGKWMDELGKLRAGGSKPDGEDVVKVWDDLLTFKPEKQTVYGPFMIDAASITEQQLELVKNPTGFGADKISFEKIVTYFGETEATVPLVLSGNIDYSTHGYTPANITAFQDQLPNVQIIRGPTGTGPGLWFNNSVPPFDKKEVRQAFAYIINREEVTTVAMGESGKAIEYMVGFPDPLVGQWLTPDTLGQLNPYPQDAAKAEELLKAAGLTKSGNAWQFAGKAWEVELQVPGDFLDWLGAAQNVSDQLNAFGIKATVQTFNSSERAKRQTEGTYQILVDLALRENYASPHAAYNYVLTTPRNNPEGTEGKGFNWPFVQTGPDGTDVDIRDLLTQMVTGFDVEAQKPAVNTMALIYNDQLPTLGLFHRFTNDPIDTTSRVTGWLPLTDAVYGNNQGADNYIAIQFLAGTLKPSETGDGTFRTSWPYSQPPKGDLNAFTENSIPAFLDPVATAAMQPPLFWYMWNEAKYVPVIGESYELR
jgi:peptide/nickel transport system substrate-binding protein